MTAEQYHPATQQSAVSSPDPEEASSSTRSGGEISQGGSGTGGVETSVGGADAVPETPDAMPGAPGAALDPAADA